MRQVAQVKFAQRLFLTAAIYGLAVVAPLLFLENQIGKYAPPSITHPEFYYGFVCVTLAWQFVYLMMSRDPLRLRPVLIPAEEAPPLHGRPRDDAVARLLRDVYV